MSEGDEDTEAEANIKVEPRASYGRKSKSVTPGRYAALAAEDSGDGGDEEATPRVDSAAEGSKRARYATDDESEVSDFSKMVQ